MSTHRTAPGVAEERLWRKSSYSDSQGGACVEVADLTSRNGTVGIRDSKDKQGPAFTVTATAWSAFVDGVGRAAGR
ncbi:DUF397 domain-containing protein [Streptomyces sp. NPDC055092]